MPIVLNGSGPVTGVTSLNTTVTDTELGYLDGVTSAIQTQINTAGGLVKIVDSTFSAQSTVSVNNCFTSTYENYRIIGDFVGSTGVGFDLKPRASGSDITTNLARQRVVFDSTTTSPAREAATWLASFAVGTNRSSLVLDWMGPQLAQKSTWLALNTASNDLYVASGLHNAATSYDGFTLSIASGTFSGTLRVYGYRN